MAQLNESGSGPDGARSRQKEFANHPERFVMVKEATGLLRKSESTVRRWIQHNELEALRVGRTLWIPLEAIYRRIVPSDEA